MRTGSSNTIALTAAANYASIDLRSPKIKTMAAAEQGIKDSLLEDTPKVDLIKQHDQGLTEIPTAMIHVQTTNK